jgi:uncharacterized repeat protein (TIGR03987 family)
MPINIAVGILSLFVALVLYSIGAWGAFRAKMVKARQLVLLWAGFGFDVIATTMMAIQAGGIQDDLHTLLAFVGMIGMLVCAILGTWGYRKSKDAVRAAVARWVLAPWAVWVFVFIWGMLSRGAGRVGF